MSNEPLYCPGCGAPLNGISACSDLFNQMLFWENAFPALGVAHHLMVLCYNLQHPTVYSREGLDYARHLLEDFIERGIGPEQARQVAASAVSSSRRAWPITARPGNTGGYPRPIVWTMVAADVVAGGPERYVDNVRAWARATHEDLMGRYPPPSA